jgi:hypothetical protein
MKSVFLQSLGGDPRTFEQYWSAENKREVHSVDVPVKSFIVMDDPDLLLLVSSTQVGMDYSYGLLLYRLSAKKVLARFQATDLKYNAYYVPKVRVFDAFSKQQDNRQNYTELMKSLSESTGSPDSSMNMIIIKLDPGSDSIGEVVQNFKGPVSEVKVKLPMGQRYRVEGVVYKTGEFNPENVSAGRCEDATIFETTNNKVELPLGLCAIPSLYLNDGYIYLSTFWATYRETYATPGLYSLSLEGSAGASVQVFDETGKNIGFLVATDSNKTLYFKVNGYEKLRFVLQMEEMAPMFGKTFTTLIKVRDLNMTAPFKVHDPQ